MVGLWRPEQLARGNGRERQQAPTKAASPSTKRTEHARDSKNKLLGATAWQRALSWIRGMVALSCATRSEIVRIGRQIRRPRGPKARRLLMETFEGRRDERKRREETRVGGKVERERGDERTRVVGRIRGGRFGRKDP